MYELTGIRAKPRNTLEIRAIANNFRAILSPNQTYFDIVKILEVDLAATGLYLELVEDKTLGDDLAKAYPDNLHIEVKETVYRDACKGCGPDRFTLAHELGHVFLHKNIPLARNYEPKNHEVFEDTEWQANTFAGELLMPLNIVRKLYPNKSKMMIEFGVSYKAISKRLQILRDRKEV